MTTEQEDRVLLLAPFGRELESADSPRYRWRCEGRGSEPFVIFQYTFSGSGIFSAEGETFDVPAGHAFIALVPERAEYYFPAVANAPWTFCWINFYGRLALSLWRRLRAETGPVIQLERRSPAVLSLLRLIRQVSTRRMHDRWDAAAESYKFHLHCWRETTAPAASGGAGIEAAVQMCDRRFRDPLNVKELAAESGMSREHFSRLFKERTGCPPASYLRNLRVRSAAELLADSNIPLTEVALRSGFQSARHLTKAFRRAHGIPPAEYRLPSRQTRRPQSGSAARMLKKGDI